VNQTVWAWEMLDGDEVLRSPISPTFTSRFDAESWLGESWRELAEQGVGAVRLVHQGQPMAPPLALHSS
jgi:hypothetical protein